MRLLMIPLFSYSIVAIIAGFVWCIGRPLIRDLAVVAAKVCNATRHWRSYVVSLLHRTKTKGDCRSLVICRGFAKKAGGISSLVVSRKKWITSSVVVPLTVCAGWRAFVPLVLVVSGWIVRWSPWYTDCVLPPRSGSLGDVIGMQWCVYMNLEMWWFFSPGLFG